jgi:glycosyltransferase involved in cell wall biosynthesis
MEPTMPLAKHIAQKGVDVDLYSLLPQGDQNAFVFDFLNNKQPSGFVNQTIMKKTFGKRLCSYLSGLQTYIFIYPTERFARLLFIDVFYAYKFAKHIKTHKYDLIHVINISRTFWKYLYFFLDKNKIVQTLHEVTSHESKTPKYRNDILKTLINNSTPVMFHSNISKDRFVDFGNQMIGKKINVDKLTVVHFGLYETYHCFSNNFKKEKDKDAFTILNLGRIVPYKGIDFLVEAVRILQEKYPIHLIIAGKGTPYFDFKEIKSYYFLNRSYTNEEAIHLIQECDMVVLPYRSGSQSGVPMTVFAFNKPIIASDLPSFKDVIDHMETGVLVDDLNAKSLATSIELLLKNKELNEIMAKNIKKKYGEGEFSWNYIAEKTLSFYRNQVKIIIE